MAYWRHMHKKAVTALALATALFAPVFVSAATNIHITFGSGGIPVGCVSDLCALGAEVLYVINFILVPVLFAVAFIVFLYGIAQAYIFSKGDTVKVEKGHTLILWGIVGFAVMLSVWGLVNVVSNTFGLSGTYAPPLPISPPPTTFY